MGVQDDMVGKTPPFRELAEALGLGVPFQLRVSADGLGREFTFVGANCAVMLGVEPTAAMANARLLFDQILPDQREPFAAAERAAFEARQAFAREVQMVGPDGAIRWRRIVSAPTILPDGSSLWDGLLTDITEAHAAAAELQEQRRRLEAAVEATGLGLWDWDVRAGTLVWSARNHELFGVPADEPMTIERYLSQVHEEDREGLGQAYQAVAQNPEGGDFVHEYRTAHQPGGKARWVQTRGRVTRDESGVILAVGTTLDISERKAAEERRALLLGELSHRAKNGIAVMMAIVAQTARGANSVESFKDVLIARLQAMADSQDLVTQTGGRTVPLADLVATTLTPFDSARFDVDSGLVEVTAPAELATALGLLLHELATNAVKYGALSNAAGRVAIASTAGPSGEIVLQWLERGGPTVRPVERKGFGSRLLEVSLRSQGGHVEPLFEPAGFKATIHLPKVVPRSTQPSGLTVSG